jgi:hypothetical protein
MRSSDARVAAIKNLIGSEFRGLNRWVFGACWGTQQSCVDSYPTSFEKSRSRATENFLNAACHPPGKRGEWMNKAPLQWLKVLVSVAFGLQSVVVSSAMITRELTLPFVVPWLTVSAGWVTLILVLLALLVMVVGALKK